VPEQPTPTPVAPAPTPEAAKPDPLASSVAAAVTKLRRDAGLSERAAAKKLGTSQTQLRRMEDPRYLPSLRSLARVASSYGATLKVSFETAESERNDKPTPPPKAVATRPARVVKPARASASPSRSPKAAPGRARAVARRPARATARRRKGR
jgi:transcriptional regulator with XRE-family HTH domain